jgi:xanthine dehydrogenase accessory factor
LTPDQNSDVLDLLRQDKSRRLAESDLFVQVHNPPPRLIIIGAVHIAQALAPMAAIANYQVNIIDPRGAFATAARFPGVSLSDDWPDEAMEALAPDSQTAIVTLTHDPKLDDPALMVALRSPAFYITSLGSRRTHAKRVERLTAAGMETDNLARLHAPAGLDIGAMSPAEIAVSIMAQMTAVRYGRNSATLTGKS